MTLTKVFFIPFTKIIKKSNQNCQFLIFEIKNQRQNSARLFCNLGEQLVSLTLVDYSKGRFVFSPIFYASHLG